MKNFLEPILGDNGRKIFKKVMFALIIGSIVIDILFRYVLHWHPHAYFEFENIPGLYAILGFCATFLLIFVTNGIADMWIKKKEDYYDR